MEFRLNCVRTDSYLLIISAVVKDETIRCLQLEGKVRELSSVEQRLRDVEVKLEQERGQWLLERTELTKRLGGDQTTAEVITVDKIKSDQNSVHDPARSPQDSRCLELIRF